jgi:drug/metabolite transporter (DMT)-like permease
MIVLEFVADWFFVQWSRENKVWMFVVGSIAYSIDGVIWGLLIKLEKLTSLSIIYSTTGIIILFFLGIVIMKEAINVQKGIALILSVLAIVIVNL